MLNVGILGFGFMGQTHYRSLSKMKDVKVLAICDNIKSCKDISDNINIYTDFDTMLDREALDALFICLPPFAHNGEFVKAANKGIHVFIEKPIALNTAIGKEMVDAANANGIISQTGFHFRVGCAVEKLKTLIDSGKTGKCCMFIGHYSCNALHSSWWRDINKSGGQILEQAIHLYDMVSYLFGSPIAVSGIKKNICHTEVENYTAEDNSAAWIEYKNGAIGIIASSNTSIPGKWDAPFRVICENVVVDFTDPNNAIFTYTKDGYTEEVHSISNLYEKEVEQFIGAIKKRNTRTCNSIVDGFNSLKLVESVTASAEKKGGKVIID